ncbi:MAG: hypothetical protein J6D27_04530 [Ruminiclostridium sp.]|nr:hypothetical protein [Ruminiclostridium sp.]
MNKNNITDSLTEKQAEAFNSIVSSSVSESGTDSLSEPLKNKDEEFDIADFIVKHSTHYNVKKSKAPRIIAIVVVAVVIIGLCVIAALASSNGNKNPIFGKWVSEQGIEMEIIEDYITIDGYSRKYIIPEGEENVIALSVNGEYVKMLYKLEDGKLHLIIPSADGELETIIYKRKRD